MEQTFGTFLSSVTHILNDSLVSDEIATVSSGNIESYKVLSSNYFEDGYWGVAVEAIISINSLKNFVVAKGYTLELNTSNFAHNMHQQKMNESGEILTIMETIGFLHNQMQKAYDYQLGLKNGTKHFESLDGSSDMFKLNMTVTAKPNKNFYQSIEYLLNILDGINMGHVEVEDYRELKKEVLPIYMKYKNENGDIIEKNYKLRTRQSLESLSLFFNLFNFYSRLYQIESGIDVQVSRGKANWHSLYSKDFSCDYRRLSRPWNSKHFLKPKQQTYNAFTKYDGVDLTNPIRVFSWEDKRSLIELENMAEVTRVEPLGIVLPFFKYGGIVLYEDWSDAKSPNLDCDSDCSVKVLSLAGRMGFNTLQNKKYIAEILNGINFNGFNDWRAAEDDEVTSFSIHCEGLGVGNRASLRDKLNPFYHLFNLPWVSPNFKNCVSNYENSNSTNDYHKLKSAKKNHKFTKYYMGQNFGDHSYNRFLFPYIIKGHARHEYYDKDGNLKNPMWTYLIRSF